jgi:hypothetical protein
MVRRFRARLSCLLTAAVLTLGTTATSLGELLHAAAPHDLACAPAVDVAHDAASHQVATPDTADPASHHCVACHLARSPRLGAQATSHVARAEAGRLHPPAAVIGSACAASLDLLPPRSPPRLG